MQYDVNKITNEMIEKKITEFFNKQMNYGLIRHHRSDIYFLQTGGL